MSMLQRERLSVIAWPACSDSNFILCVLFSAYELFQLNEILMYLLSCLSIIFSSFYAHVRVTKIINNISILTQ